MYEPLAGAFSNRSYEGAGGRSAGSSYTTAVDDSCLGLVREVRVEDTAHPSMLSRMVVRSSVDGSRGEEPLQGFGGVKGGFGELGWGLLPAPVSFCVCRGVGS